MKKFLNSLPVIVALLFAGSASAQTFDFSDIQYWVGSGSNEAAFVVAWNDGKTPDSLVWGYKWSGGTPTVLNMMQAIELADSRLSFTAVPGFDSGSNYAVFSVYYDLTGLGGTPVVGTPGNEDGAPPNPGDHYEEGWYVNGFWGELTGTGGGNPYSGGGSWDSNDTQGIGVDTVTNGSWWGLSFSSDFVDIPNPALPTAVTPAPEPSTMALAALGISILCGRRRRRGS